VKDTIKIVRYYLLEMLGKR